MICAHGPGLARSDGFDADIRPLPGTIRATFDLVLDFGILRHVGNWRDALAEVHKILRPGGEFLFEDLSAETWERGIGVPLKRIADHPCDKMFTKQEFVDELKALGFDVETHESSPFSFYYF